ncbi:MAG: extracellular solute-binding protein, partial [Pseudomonadota bacterium]
IDPSRRRLCAGLLSLPFAEVSAQEIANILGRARSLSAGLSKPLRMLLPRGSEANVQPVVDRFARETGAKVELIPSPVSDINTHLLIAHGRGASYDVALPATYGLADLVAAGALQALDDLAPGYAVSASRSSLFPLGDVVGGRLYGLQTDGDVYVMFYNRRLLENTELSDAFAARYGERPRPARSFGELDQLMQFFHAPEQNRYGGVLFRAPGFLAWEFWIRLHAAGRFPFNRDMRPQLTTDESVSALKALVSASRWQHPAVMTDNLTDNWKRFAQGEALCNIGWGGSQKYWRRRAAELGRDILVAPLPGLAHAKGIARLGYFNWGWNYAVPARSTHPELAALFACYAVSPRASALAVREPDGFFDPFQPEHFLSPGIEQVYGRNFLDVQRDALSHAIPDLYLPGRSGYMDSLDDYLHRANSGDLSPTEALRAVESIWEAHTDRLGRRRQVSAWRDLRARYPSELRSLLS